MACSLRRLLILHFVAFLVSHWCTTSVADEDKCAGVKCADGQVCRVVRAVCRRCTGPQPQFVVCVNATSG
ncbi:hypothetical protein J6590_002719 [Homalodisca vitripennis]|nr:hypothetical protein J6590_002719 [Homalodisca vitripennis]